MAAMPVIPAPAERAAQQGADTLLAATLQPELTELTAASEGILMPEA